MLTISILLLSKRRFLIHFEIKTKKQLVNNKIKENKVENVLCLNDFFMKERTQNSDEERYISLKTEHKTMDVI